ncbi:hypothetical protein [Candidatus Leptofilum sp.]|uniref:hypothetical protein n=1 Tax=Candidatus Leptofilum sp. TaxID=3241576 RepID=UPI003B59A73E
MELLETIGFYFGFVADTIAFFGIPYTVWQLHLTRQKEKHLQQEIGIRLSCTESGKTIGVPFKIRRRNFSRAEILGYLGMVAKQGDRYSLNYLKSTEFLQEVKRIQDATNPETFTIPCGRKTDDKSLEIKQFEIDSSIQNRKS